jgi:hypothetical protein
MSSYCQLCKHTLAYDSIEIECGKHGNDLLPIDLCEAHLTLAQDHVGVFDEIYADRIDELNVQHKVRGVDLSDVG